MSDSSRSFRLSNYFLLLTNATRAQLHRSKFLSQDFFTSSPPPLPRRLSTRAISKINCLVLGETQQRIFPVKIDATENVGTLKQLIKEEEKHDLDYALR